MQFYCFSLIWRVLFLVQWTIILLKHEFKLRKLDSFITSRPICWWGFIWIRWILPPLRGEWRVLGPLLLHRICPLKNKTEKRAWGPLKRWCHFGWLEQNQVHHPPQNTRCHLLMHRSRPVWHKLHMVFTHTAGWFNKKTIIVDFKITFSLFSAIFGVWVPIGRCGNGGPADGGWRHVRAVHSFLGMGPRCTPP